MTRNTAYKKETTFISKEKMEFKIINLHPKYPSNELSIRKTEAQQQLFAVFKKYACEN